MPLNPYQQKKLTSAANLVPTARERECFVRSVMGRLGQQPTDADLDCAICFVLSAYGIAVRRSALKLLYLRELENAAASKGSSKPPERLAAIRARKRAATADCRARQRKGQALAKGVTY